MEDLLSLIGNLGFPIAVSAFMLLRMEAKLEKLNDTLVSLKVAIEGLDG